MAFKRLDGNIESFKTEAHSYSTKNWLTFDEWKQFEKYEVQTGFGSNFESLFASMNKALALMNRLDFTQASAVLWNTVNSVKQKIDEREHPALMLCTLFIVRDGDHDRVWNEALAKEYIEDWKKEYTVNDFFCLAVGLVNGFQEAYETLSEVSLAHLKKIEKPNTSDGKEKGTCSGIK